MPADKNLCIDFIFNTLCLYTIFIKDATSSHREGESVTEVAIRIKSRIQNLLLLKTHLPFTGSSV